MYCQKCQKNSKTPLELYNGKMACPLCLQISEVTTREMAVTDENKELYEIAEVCFLNGLKASDEKEYENYISQAVKLCRQAAEKGNPFAIMRLGFFYDKDYLELEQSEAFRCRIAYTYYTTILNSTPRQDIEGFEQLKETTRKLLIQLLMTMPEELKKEEKYNIARNIKQFALKAQQENEYQQASLVTKKSMKNIVLQVVKLCSAKGRVPLFAFFKNITKDEVLSLLKNDDFVNSILAETPTFYLKEPSSESSEAIRNRIALKVVIDKIEANSAEGLIYSIIIFNRKVSHHYFTKKDIEKLKTKLSIGGMKDFKLLIKDSLLDYCVFYEDDIYFHGKKNIANGLDGLFKEFNQK